MLEYVMKPIGIIHTPFHDTSNMPIQSARSEEQGKVEVFPEYIAGLEGIADFSHIYLLYAFHLANPDFNLRVQPFLDDQVHGLFATRYPVRPNPIGLSIVRITAVQGNVIFFNGADMLDGTPLLDIKPYIPEFDIFAVEKTGWYQQRKHP